MVDVGLRLHPDKTRIVYCKDSNRRGMHDTISFTFLGYTFRLGQARNKRKEVKFTSFQPAMSREEAGRERPVGPPLAASPATERHSGRPRAVDQPHRAGLDDLLAYWGRFYRTEMDPLLKRINTYLMRWARKK